MWFSHDIHAAKKHRSWNLHRWRKSGSSMSCNFFHDNNCDKPSEVAFVQSSDPLAPLGGGYYISTTKTTSTVATADRASGPTPTFRPKGIVPASWAGKKPARLVGEKKTIFCWDIPLHRPYIGLIYGRYLQFFRFLSHGHWIINSFLGIRFSDSDPWPGTHMTRGPILQALRRPKTLVDVR